MPRRIRPALRVVPADPQAAPQLTEDARLNALRCGVCGAWHPYVTVCPWIVRQRIERDLRTGVVLVVDTVYHHGRVEAIADQSVNGIEEARAIVAALVAAPAAESEASPANEAGVHPADGEPGEGMENV